MSTTVNATLELVKKLEAQRKPWLEIQSDVESAGIKLGGFKPLFVGCESSPYRLRFIPTKQPALTSREFDEKVHRIAEKHSLILETRCTGYFLYKDTGSPSGISQTIRKHLRMVYKTKLLRVFYLDKYGIELEHPDFQGAPETLEEIGTTLYGMAD